MSNILQVTIMWHELPLPQTWVRLSYSTHTMGGLVPQALESWS